MDELSQRLDGLRERVAPAWDRERKDRAYRGVQRVRRARSLRARGSIAGVGVLGLALCVSYFGRASEAGTGTRVAARASLVVTHASGRVTLSEGSDIEVTSAEGEISVEHDRPDHVALRLDSGSAHFEVVPNMPRRQFSVSAGSIEVVVVGTRFDVAVSRVGARVAVSHGKVRVQSRDGSMFLEAGQAREFESQAAAPAPASPLGLPSRSHVLEPPRRASAIEMGAKPAPVKLVAAQPHVAAAEVDALMEAADAARVSGHPETAALYLHKVVSRHRTSPATPLAAFTLGRLLLERLDRPAEAAAAFATARELQPQGSLAQDALAREVEAWSKAGRSSEASARAKLFLSAYPNSRRARVVELYLAAPQP